MLRRNIITTGSTKLHNIDVQRGMSKIEITSG